MNIENEYIKWKTYYSATMTWDEFYYSFILDAINRTSKQRDYKRNNEINRSQSGTKLSEKKLKYKVEMPTVNDIYFNENHEIIYEISDGQKIYEQTKTESITHIFPFSYVEFQTDTVNAYVDFPDVIYSEDRFFIDNNGNLILKI